MAQQSIPANIGTGLIKGRFVVGVADGGDADTEPDYIPAVGRVVITANVPYFPVIDPGPGDHPFTHLNIPVTLYVDDQGYVCRPNPLNPGTPGDREYRAIAHDTPAIPVHDWTYKVEYFFDPVNGVKPELKTRNILVATGSVIDLTMVVPVPESPGIGEDQAPVLVALAQAAAVEANAAAQIVADAAETTDTLNASFVADPASATAAALDAVYAKPADIAAALPVKQDKASLDADVAGKILDPASDVARELSATIGASIDAVNTAKRAGLKLHADYVGTQREGAPGMTVGALLQYNAKSASATDLGTATLTVTGPHYVTTAAPHGLVVGDRIRFGAGTLPATVSVGTNYYVMAVVNATTVQLYREGLPGTRLQWTTDGSAPLYKWPLATSFAASRDTGLLNPAFRFTNAPAIQSAATAPYRDWVKANPAALTYAPGTLTGPSVTLETIITGKSVDLLLVNNIGYSTRIWIDGRLAITLTPTDFTTAGIAASTGLGRLGISFTAKAQRKIGVEVMQGNVAGVEYLDAEPPLFPTDQRGARTMVQGDSFTEGGSAGLTGMPYVAWMQKLLGWTDTWRSGSGATGYVTAGTRTALISRWQNDIVAQAPDRLILAHGINDSVATSEAVATAAATIIDGTLAALPATEIIVVGPFSPKGKVYAAGYLAGHDAALQAVAKARGLQFISPLQEDWITGNGNVSVPTGNGNSDVYISADGTHPTPAGHEYIGWRLAGHLSG